MNICFKKENIARKLLKIPLSEVNKISVSNWNLEIFIAHGVITKLKFRNTARVLFLWCTALDLWGMI